MANFEVTLNGNFVTEMIVEADSRVEAEKKAEQQLDKIIGLQSEDYVIDLVCAGEVK